jgi:hypothetical protein
MHPNAHHLIAQESSPGQIGGFVEQRVTTRYRMELPVIFEWSDKQGIKQQGAGFTRNISTSGIYVVSSATPPPETTLVLEVIVPPSDSPAQDVRLRSEGKLVRVEQDGFVVSGSILLSRHCSKHQ